MEKQYEPKAPRRVAVAVRWVTFREKMQYPKNLTYRNNKYLTFIRELDCSVAGCPNQNIIAHHEGSHGTSIKTDDTNAIPLCHEHHLLRHQIGVSTFAGKFCLDYKDIIISCLKKYIEDFT